MDHSAHGMNGEALTYTEVGFLDGMIPHHLMALEMARMVINRYPVRLLARLADSKMVERLEQLGLHTLSSVMRLTKRSARRASSGYTNAAASGSPIDPAMPRTRL